MSKIPSEISVLELSHGRCVLELATRSGYRNVEHAEFSAHCNAMQCSMEQRDALEMVGVDFTNFELPRDLTRV